MLYAIIGKPGQGKSYFAVTKMYEQQELNNHNIQKNVEIHFENKAILKDRGIDLDTRTEFTFPRESKEDDQTVIRDFTFRLNHFLKIEDEEQFEDYFEMYLLYNDFIKHINSIHGITLAFLLPVRQIYSDINGLKINGIKFAPRDWRETPLGSILYIDEIRRKPPYNYDGNRPSTDPIILGMSEVRHSDKDVYLISQDAEDLNKSLRQLVDKMYFIKRPPQNVAACAIYTFDQWIGRPRAAADSKREPKKYVDHQILTYKKKYFALYKSASSHVSMKRSISWKVFAWILFFIVLVLGVLVGLAKIPIFQYFGSAISQMTGSESNSLEGLKGAPMPDASKNPEIQNKVNSCMEQFGWTEQQCLEAADPTIRDQRHDELQQRTRNDMETIVFDYNPSNPFADMTSMVSYEPTAKPVFSGCMKQHGRYVAYTQQGTILKNVSQDDCRRIIEQGDRPFNYFQQPQQQVQQPPTQQENPAYQKSYLENLARLDAQAAHSSSQQRERSVPEQQVFNPETSSL